MKVEINIFVVVVLLSVDPEHVAFVHRDNRAVPRRTETGDQQNVGHIGAYR